MREAIASQPACGSVWVLFFSGKDNVASRVAILLLDPTESSSDMAWTYLSSDLIFFRKKFLTLVDFFSQFSATPKRLGALAVPPLVSSHATCRRSEPLPTCGKKNSKTAKFPADENDREHMTPPNPHHVNPLFLQR